jgi:hypothetical protein
LAKLFHVPTFGASLERNSRHHLLTWGQDIKEFALFEKCAKFKIAHCTPYFPFFHFIIRDLAATNNTRNDFCKQQSSPRKQIKMLTLLLFVAIRNSSDSSV